MSEPFGTSVPVEQIENKTALREAKKIAELSAEERKQYNRLAKKKSRASEAAKQSVVGRKYYSTTELKKQDAFEILEKERKIRNQRVLEVEVSDTALRQRLAQWKPPQPRYPTGVFGKYAALVSSASEGAITRPK